MSELIEKQKVLDVLREIATEKFSLDDPYGVYINVLMDVEEKICHLPVVQPNGPDNLVKDIQVLAKDLANDAISRQEAIDIVNKYDKSHMILMGKPMLGATSIVIELEDLPSVQPEQRWIPCSERLPENGGRYLISVLDGINRRTTVAPYLPRCKAWTMTGRMAYWKVIAWMPLPEPYREEEQDG